jgi:hypothetical protein
MAEAVAAKNVENSTRDEEHRKLFLTKIEQISNKKNTKLITKQEKATIVEALRMWESLPTAERKGKYVWHEKFDFLRLGNDSEPFLFYKKDQEAFTDGDKILLEKMVQLATKEELFDVLTKIHRDVGHGKVKKMMPAVSRKYSNISRLFVEAFCKTCSRCNEGAPRPAARAGHTPIITSGFNSRAQVDLIDMQTAAVGEYKWIMVYQDHGMKFAHIKKMKTKKTDEVANKLLNIFLLQGAPAILQSDNGKEFVSHVIRDLGALWPGLKLINGRPRHSQSQGSVERLNRCIEEMMHKWLADHPGSTWTDSLPFLQWQYNTRMQESIKKTPYMCVYGCNPRIGFDTMGIEQLESLEDEEQVAEELGSRGIEWEGNIPTTSNNEEEPAPEGDTDFVQQDDTLAVEVTSSPSSPLERLELIFCVFVDQALR